MDKKLPFLLTIFILPTIAYGQIQFSDVTNQSGLAFIGINYGVSTVDYNKDGLDDIFAISQAHPCRLFRNDGNGTFTDVAPELGLDYQGTCNAAGWADINNDGNLDLLITNRNENNVFFLGNDDGTFTENTFFSGLMMGGQVKALLFSDINLDGLLDIYLARINQQNILYLNIGNSQFINFTNASGALDYSISMGAVFFDYDNDGDPDLYLTHDADIPNILYQNNGEGLFTDVSEGSGANIGTNGMGVDVADVNQDGWMDIYVTNLSFNSLLINNGDGTFYETGVPAGVGDPGMGWGCTFLEVNNDGWQDIYAVNDSYFAPLPNVLYQNKRDLTFDIVSENTPLASMEAGYGVATLDFDNDGLTDIYLTNLNGTKGNQLFRNDYVGIGSWVKLNLEGTESNRDAIGARVTLEVGDMLLVDELLGTSGYASQNSFTMHFGLGFNFLIDKMTINWPNGLEEVFENLPVNTTYSIVEGEGTFATTASEKLNNELSVNIFPNPFSDKLNIQLLENNLSEIVLMDIFGNTVNEIKLDQFIKSYQLPLNDENFIDGIYFLKIKSAKGEKNFKIVKK